MSNVRFFEGSSFRDAVRIIQKLNLHPIEKRLEAIMGAGYNIVPAA